MTLETALFHTELFIPNEAKPAIYEGVLTYSAHARREAESDRYGGMELPKECRGHLRGRHGSRLSVHRPRPWRRQQHSLLRSPRL